MRTFELLTLIIATAGVVWWLIAPPPRRIHISVAVGWLALAVVQALAEGTRVHLVPTYALGAALVGLAWWRPRRRARALIAIPVGATVLVAAALPIVFPV